MISMHLWRELVYSRYSPSYNLKSTERFQLILLLKSHICKWKGKRKGGDASKRSASSTRRGGLRRTVRLLLFLLHPLHLHQLFHFQIAVRRRLRSLIYQVYYDLFFNLTMDDQQPPNQVARSMGNSRFSFSSRKLLLRPKPSRGESREVPS